MPHLEQSTTWDEWDKDHLTNCRFVAKQNGEVVGWVALPPNHDVCIFRSCRGQYLYCCSAAGMGVGSRLLHHIIDSSEQNKSGQSKP